MPQNKGVLILLGLLVVVLLFLLYRFFAVAVIDVTSNPAGALVTIDGERIGLTPLRADVPSGIHLFEVQHSFYSVYQERIDFSTGETVTRDVSLDAGKGSLRVLSNPKGATVDVNGVRQAGLTPMRLELSGGMYEILISLDERRVIGEMVEVIADQVVEVNKELQIQPHGSLSVLVQPFNATVVLVGTELKYTPKVRLPVGEYGIEVSHPGYVQQNFRYVVNYSDNVTSVKLEREYAALKIDVVPSNADVRVSYRDEGQTVSKSYAPGMQVPVGKVEVRARAMSHRTEFQEIQVPAKGKTLSFKLPSMSVSAGSSIRDKLNGGGVGPAMVVIPAGSFVMGREGGPPSERPAHRVTITQPFAMGKYEVTVEEYLHYAKAIGKAHDPKMDISQAQYPATMVTWEEARAYAEWLSQESKGRYRLPSEAEWEYAARGGTNSLFSFGDDAENICDYANLADKSTREAFRDWQVVDCDDGAVRLAPVGSLRGNGFGLYDVAGNVSEWVLECGMPNYQRVPNDGSKAAGSNCVSHSYRGGSWDSTPDELQVAYRNTGISGNQDRGFRLVREL